MLRWEVTWDAYGFVPSMHLEVWLGPAGFDWVFGKVVKGILLVSIPAPALHL